MTYRKTQYVEDKLNATRTRILEVARELVESGGWANCTLTRVATGAGVASGSVYTHFDKISDLYSEVFLEIAREELAIMSQIAGAQETPSLRLDKAVMTTVGRAMRGPVRAYAALGEPVAPETETVRQEFRSRFVTEYERIIKDGIRSGEFRNGNPRVMATCLLGAMSEALIRPMPSKSKNSKSDQQRIKQEISDFCLSAIIPGMFTEEK